MKTKTIIIGATSIMIVSIAFKLYSNKKQVEENIYRPDLEKDVLVKIENARLISLEKTFSYTGTFIPNREVLVIPQVKGQVENVYFSEGDTVRQGQVLIQIDDDILQAQYAAAQSNYAISKRNVERNEIASKSGGVSNIQLDNYHLNLSSAESELKQLKKQIEWSRISASFAGTITMRDVEVGTIVDNKPLARITDTNLLKLEIDVPEKEIVQFADGDKVAIQTDVYPGQLLEGRIEYISNRADDSHNYTVKIVINNSKKNSLLRSGMYGTVMIKSAGAKETLVIPRAALIGSSKTPQVVVVQDGKAAFRNIKTGGNNADLIEVIQGLEPGDAVVIGGHINLSEGSNVQVSN